MAVRESSKNEKQLIELCIEALHEKDRLNYAGKFVQGFVHNANGPLQNLTMLTEMLASSTELQDRLFRNNCGDNEQWSELLQKQRKRLAQTREQISKLASDLREFMQLHEIANSGTEIDINSLLTIMSKVFRSDLFFKHSVKSELRLTPNLPHIKVPGRAIVPAIFHLFQNSIHAMKKSPEKKLIIETCRQDESIVVRMLDSGCGLGEEPNPDAFFDLFESGWQNNDDKGSHLGFGLYAARQLLLPYGFTVSLENRDGGALARIRMPL